MEFIAKTAEWIAMIACLGYAALLFGMFVYTALEARKSVKKIERESDIKQS